MKGLDGRTPLSYMHVTFPIEDQIGEIFAWISMVPLCFFMVQAALVISIGQTRSQKVKSILILLGQFLNEILNYYLKDVFQEARPNSNITLNYSD
jgi:hypothetical protein